MSHLFCISREVWSALSVEEVQATVAGLRELGLYHLPYEDELIVRMGKNSKAYFEVRGLREGEEFSMMFVVREHRRHYGNGRPDFDLKSEDHGVPIEPLPDQFEGNEVLYRFKPVDSNLMAQSHWRDGLITILASKGTDKRERQNKRAKLGIGSASADYITTIKLSPSLERGTHEEAKPGKPVRPHLRRGHIRNQHYGAGNQFIKRIWIDPVFVNADENFISTRTSYRIVH